MKVYGLDFPTFSLLDSSFLIFFKGLLYLFYKNYMIYIHIYIYIYIFEFKDDIEIIVKIGRAHV